MLLVETLVLLAVLSMGYEICDYHLVGDRSKIAKQSSVRKDEKGFLVNAFDRGDSL